MTIDSAPRQQHNAEQTKCVETEQTLLRLRMPPSASAHRIVTANVIENVTEIESASETESGGARAASRPPHRPRRVSRAVTRESRRRPRRRHHRHADATAGSATARKRRPHRPRHRRHRPPPRLCHPLRRRLPSDIANHLLHVKKRTASEEDRQFNER